MLLRDYTQYFKTNPLCKDGNALYKSAPFILIIAGRELRVSISKMLFKLTKKLECTLVYSVNATQLPLQKCLEIIECFNKVFKTSNTNISFLQILFAK